MVNRCLICQRPYSKTSNIAISFHRFQPRWTMIIKNVSRSAVVCSEHFSKSDFVLKPSGIRYLKKGATPVINADEKSKLDRNKFLEVNVLSASTESIKIPELHTRQSDIENFPIMMRKLTEQNKERDLNISFSQNISNIKEEHEGNDYLDNKVYISETNLYKQDIETKNCGEDVKTEQCGTSVVNNIKTELYEMESDIITPDTKMEYASNDSDKNDIEMRNCLTEKYEMPMVGNIKMELLPEIENDIIDDIKIEDGIGDANIKLEVKNEPLFCNNCHDNYRNYCTKCGMLVHILNANTQSKTDNTAVKEIPTDILEIRESSDNVGIFAMKGIPVGVRFGPFTGLNATECPGRLKWGKFIVPEGKSVYLNWMQYINPARDMFQQNLLPFQFEDNLYYRSNRQIQEGEELLVYFGGRYEAKLNDNVILDFIPPIEDDFKDVFACTLCCLGFSSREYLMKHKSTCPRENNGIFLIEELTQCQFCKIYLDKNEYIEYHKSYCSQINIRKCVQFNDDARETQNYCTSNNIEATQTTVYLPSEKVTLFKCGECGFQSKRMRNLRAHTKTKHLKEFDYNCDKCEFRTNSKNYIKIHRKTEHLKEFDYNCDICDYKINIKGKLEEHIKAKHLKQFKYSCETCEYRTNHRSKLKFHEKTKHLREFRYKCQFCEFKAELNAQLRTHIRAKHLKEFNYNCESCDFKTNYENSLKMHLKSKHLKEFKYKCESCAFETNYETNVKVHVKAKHLNECYKCELCEFKTNYGANLKAHVKSVHLKESRYQCDKCDFKTYYGGNLKAHAKAKHLKDVDHYKSNRK